MKRSGWDGATIDQRMLRSGIKDSATATNDNRGATASPTPSSNARAFTRHRHGNVPSFVLGRGRGTTVLIASLLSTAPTPSSDACAFTCHRHGNVHAFVLGQGRRCYSADCVVVVNSGTRGDVNRGRRGADEAEGDADNNIC